MTDVPRFPHADLIFRLRGLTMGATVLVVGAHPDDEETGVLAYLCRGRAVRAVYWSATRGEGGQNRVGPERGPALGIIRSWESLAARQVDGGEVLYGPFYDFGFVKTADAALERWGHDQVVLEIARAIRLVQPQVVISRWSGGPADGHGHHRAIGLATSEAFDAAADAGLPGLDPARYPPWQAAKLYQSVAGDWQPGEDWDSGTRNPAYDEAGFVRVNAGAVDAVTGSTYEEVATESRNRHRSQGLAFLPARGDYFYYLRLARSLVGGSEPETDVFDGLDPTLAGLADALGGSPALRARLEQAGEAAQAAVGKFRPHQPGEAAGDVLLVVDALRQAEVLVEAAHWPGRAAALQAMQHKIGAASEVAAACLGISAECEVDRAHATPGQAVRLTSRLWTTGELAGEAVAELQLPGNWGKHHFPVPVREGTEFGEMRSVDVELPVPDDAPFSTPYWLRRPRSPYRYAWPDDGPLGRAFDEPMVSAVWHVSVEGRELTLVRPARRREACPGGYRELPLAILPPVALRPQEAHVFLPATTSSQRLELRIGVETIEAGGDPSALTMAVPEGWAVHPVAATLQPATPGSQQSVAVEVVVPPMLGDAVHQLSCLVRRGDRGYGVTLNPVRLAGPGAGPVNAANCAAETLVVAEASVAVHVIDAAFVRTLRYGYLPGADESILAALARFELDVTVIDGDDLPYTDLHQYDALVVGPNAYVMRDGVARGAAQLLAYVERGGTLIVQYQTYPYEAPGLAPFPVRYHRPHDRVTLPDAPVTVLDAAHPALTSPNKITAEDFEGWVHDRGMYFLGEFDPRYTALLACHDPGENPQPGGLLIAPYGQGTFVYAGYSFFRQIPAGVPGAIRLFANLLGLPETKILERMERLRTIELFSSLDETQAYQVARVMSERYWNEGEVLCRQGDGDSDLFVIRHGEIEVLKEAADGSSRRVYLAGPGEAVGELALLADIPRSATLQAVGPVTALVMRGGDFRRLMERQPEISSRLVTILARKLAGSGS